MGRVIPSFSSFPLRIFSPSKHSSSFSSTTLSPFPPTRNHFSCSRFSKLLAMEASKFDSVMDLPIGIDPTTEEEYSSQSKILQDFTKLSSIDKAWTFKSGDGTGSQAMFSVSQANLLANKRRKFILSAQISEESTTSVKFQWAPFPVEMAGVSTMVPSPSGNKLLVVRNPENESPCKFEIWGQAELEKEFLVPQSVHGSVYADGWFEGVSWNTDETLIAYVAEEPLPTKPTFSDLGYKKGGATEKDFGSWKGQGDWEEDWGESYAGKRQPALYVINANSGEVKAVKGIEKHLSVGQVIWGPSREGTNPYLVFVGWSSSLRKLGIIHCYNRPCSLYGIRAPYTETEANKGDIKDGSSEVSPVINLTQSISSSIFPRFSPDGKFLVFLSSKSAVDSGAHAATESLHRIEWPMEGEPSSSLSIVDVIPVIMSAEDGQCPGIYLTKLHSNPWLSDGCTMILPSVWGSRQVLLSVNVLSAVVSRITPKDSDFSWNFLTFDGDNVIAVSSSPVDVPQIKYGTKADKNVSWSWSDVPSPIGNCSEKVKVLLSDRQFSILKIPVNDVSDSLTEGAKKPFEAIFVSSANVENNCCDPLIVVLHGGPHTVSLTSFSKSYAFLSSLGYNLLIVNYRGSTGFGEEALQSLPGKIGTQDVNDVLSAIDYVIKAGNADPKKIGVVGGSHGGFLTTHLIGQAPDTFFAAAVRNPVCNLPQMLGTTDIPDWCYFETYGIQGIDRFTEAASAEDLIAFHEKSPMLHISKVKTPTIFLVGAMDRRVQPCNGLQYARALKEKGVDVKVILFPNDTHALDRPQSDFESFLNIGVWFKKYCK